MLAALNGFHRRKSMMVVGRGDHHTVDLFHLVQHLPVICELLRPGIPLENAGGMVLIHIAQGDDVLALHLAKVVGPLPPDADANQIQLLIRGGCPAQAQHPPRHNHETSRGKCGATQKLAASERNVASSNFIRHTLRL